MCRIPALMSANLAILRKSWLLIGAASLSLSACRGEAPNEHGPKLSKSVPQNEAPSSGPNETLSSKKGSQSSKAEQASVVFKDGRISRVNYVIKRGGTAKQVANLYKLHHWEIEQLNPDLDIDRELPAGQPVIIYRQDASGSSESIGSPDSGSLRRAVPMVEGPGRILTAKKWKSWATDTTISQLDHFFKSWAQNYPEAPPILVGNLSARDGGHLDPHKSHQSGRDVDIAYPTLGQGDPPHWEVMTQANLDSKRTWQLLMLLRKESKAEVLFMDRSLQQELDRYARANHLIPEAELGRWLQYSQEHGSSAGSGRPFIQHVPGHRDHLHIRLSCPESSKRCR